MRKYLTRCSKRRNYARTGGAGVPSDATGPIAHRRRALAPSQRDDLLNDLYDLPRRNVARKINEFVKRTRATKIHAYIMAYLRAKVPTFGKEKWHARQLEKMEETFQKVAAQHALAPGDFPPVEYFREKMQGFKVHKIPSISKRAIERLDEVLSEDLPRMMQQYGNPFAEAASY